MPVIRFSIDKIEVEKQNPPKGQINVKNNISIKNVSEKELALGNVKKDGIKFDYEFTLAYEEKIGYLKLLGHMLYFDEQLDPKNLIKNWKKEKHIPTEIIVELVNNIILKCGVKALTLAEVVNLPPHIRFPMASAKSSPEKYIG